LEDLPEKGERLVSRASGLQSEYSRQTTLIWATPEQLFYKNRELELQNEGVIEGDYPSRCMRLSLAALLHAAVNPTSIAPPD